MTILTILGSISHMINQLCGVGMIWYAVQLYQGGYISPMVTETPIEATFYIFLMFGLMFIK